ncbi:MAG TPA: hypothetical protein PKA05_04685 [Roseiflexaceae bacterium]|nr:hypothetical protein [Roseiflexaceae bacterium]HMP39657.1 hypothetical protein [Roseiflexaceae bacterium]
MPKVRKLTADEVKLLERRGKSERRIIEEQYDEILAEFAAGDYGDVDLESNEKRPTVKNRLRAAAERRQLGIKFFRMRGEQLRFQLTERNEATNNAEQDPIPVPVLTTTAAPKNGRRKKKEEVAVEPPKGGGRRGRRRNNADT